MREARLPLAYRDSCAHLLIPLNKCRRDTWYAPWKCSVCRAAAAESARPVLRPDMEDLLTDNVPNRTSATATRSASTSSLRNELPRWMSCGSRRAERGATEHGRFSSAWTGRGLYICRNKGLFSVDWRATSRQRNASRCPNQPYVGMVCLCIRDVVWCMVTNCENTDEDTDTTQRT